MLIPYDSILGQVKPNKTISSARKESYKALKPNKNKYSESASKIQTKSMSICKDNLNKLGTDESTSNLNIFSLHEANVYKDNANNHKNSTTAKNKYKNTLRRKVVRGAKSKRLSTHGKNFNLLN